MTKINTPDEAINLANRIAKFAVSKDFKPFEFESDFKKSSSDSQREYYWAVIIESQYNYFKNDILKFCEYVFKAVRADLSRELIHTMNKFVYNGGKSTQRLKTDEREVYHDKIRQDMFHNCKIDIPLPNQEEKCL